MNDKVRALNKETENPLRALAILYKRFEQVNSAVRRDARIDGSSPGGSEAEEIAMNAASDTR